MESSHTFLMRAVGATINVATGFDPMADDLAAAMLALGPERVDGAFKAVEIMGDAVHHDFERLIIFVSTDFTLGHKFPFNQLRCLIRARLC